MTSSALPTQPVPIAGDLRSGLVADLPAAERPARIAEIPTAILQGGDGPPMVLLHGPGEFGPVWLRVLPDLVVTNTVIVPDLPGHGASGVGRRELTASVVLQWLGELIDRTCTEPPILVGHLLGGAIAARFAAANPERVRGVVLVDSHGLAPLRPSPRFALALLPFLVHPTPGTQRRLMEACLADRDAVRAAMRERLEELEAYALERARTGEQKAAVRRLMPQFGMPQIPADELARISAPVTLIWGRHDLQVRLAVAEAASARHGWPLHVIEDARDDPAVEQPEAFLRALRSALPTLREAS